ncbi:MAG: hypothetical protein ACLR8P_10560 [Clostridium fessum]
MAVEIWGKSAVAAASSTSASEISNEAGKGNESVPAGRKRGCTGGGGITSTAGRGLISASPTKSRGDGAGLMRPRFAVDTHEDADGMQYEAVSVADGSRFLLIPAGRERCRKIFRIFDPGA